MDEQVRRISRNDSRRGFRESETVALTSSGCRSVWSVPCVQPNLAQNIK